MNAQKVIAAVVSVAILGSSLAVFNSSSQSYKRRISATSATSASMYEGRPITTLAPVVVYATSPGHGTVSALEDSVEASTQAGASPVVDSGFQLGSQLHMPYYSFGTDLRTLIKE